MSLFNLGNFKLHSGYSSNFKIDCDALTCNDIDSIAYLMAQRFQFSHVVGVPTGGTRLEAALKQYRQFNTDQCLIVDDVLTTGNSMEAVRDGLGGLNIKGVVIFARGKCPQWITPLFQLWYV